MRDEHYVKSHGLGNDYLVIDPALLPEGIALAPATARLLCDRHRGVGGDGVLEPRPARDGADFGLRIWNPDGGEAEKSGNGLRIFAKYLYEHGHTAATRFAVATPGGVAGCELRLDGAMGRVAAVTVEMGAAVFAPLDRLVVGGAELAVTALSVGNPHCVVVVPDLGAVDLARLGPAIERHPAFPARTNVQFAQPVGADRVRALIWERGAGETLASGSSSCAVAAACHRLGLTGRAVTVEMPGGELRVRIDDREHLWLTGPVEEVCRGAFSPDLLARLHAAGGDAE
ncbi:MAG TPA: diaminopimelate epimerase [Thermomicrobiales bacterium]|nr:diaminopimelate epimerase [Thermomicrobiales bacterium]